MAARVGRDTSRLGSDGAKARRRTRTRVQPSALLLALVRRSDWLWLRWLVARWEMFRTWRATRQARRAAALSMQGNPSFKIESLEPRLLLSADLAPGAPSLQTFDQNVTAYEGLATPNGSADRGPTMKIAAAVPLPSIQVSGPGAAEVQALSDGGYTLRLSGTTSASSVTLTGTTRVLFKSVWATSDVGAVNLALADLQGTAQFAGSVASLSFGQIAQSALTVQGSGAFTLKATSLRDAQLTARNAALTLNVADWLATAPGASRVTASTLTAASVTGDFGADLFLNGPTTGFALGTVAIGGKVQGGIWSIHGRANSISIGSSASDWRVNIDGALTQLVSKGDVSGDLAVAALQVLQIGGSARALHVMVGANLGDDAALGGTGANADSFKAGTLARIRVVGDVVDSNFYVGVDPVDGALNDGNDKQLGSAANKLQEFTVGGGLQGRTSIVAPGFPATVRIGTAVLDPAGLPQFRSTPADVVPPALTSLGLAAGSDTGVLGDGITYLALVRLEGVGEPAAKTTLRRYGSSAVVATGVVAGNGTFGFDEIAVDLGDTVFEVTLADAAGNSTTGKFALTRIPAPDLAPPTLAAQLVNDTGASSSDGRTSDPAIAGLASDNVGVAHLFVSIDPAGMDAPTTSLDSSLGADGRFTLSREMLDTLAGGKLADGAHTVRLLAKDAAGNASSQLNVSFTLDSAAPGITGFGLAPASDTGTPNDRVTDLAKVQLIGTGEPGASSALRVAGAGAVLATGTVGADTKFSFDDVALAIGETTFEVMLTDLAGNTSISTLTVTRSATADQIPPTLAARLANDTGSSATDGQTADPTISGKAADNIGVAHLYAVVDPAGGELPTAQLDGLVAADGSFTLTRSVMEALIGGSLGDGTHTVRLQAADAAGNKSAVLNVQFTLDSASPDFTAFGLSNADAINATLDETSAATAQLKGTAEPGATIRLEAQGLSTTASGSGSFVLPGVQLKEGSNALTLTAIDAAGNATRLSRTITRTTVVQSDAVLTWSDVALRAIQRDVTDPPVATRVLAVMSLAQYDTLAAIEGTPAFVVQRTVTGAVNAQAAAAQAAYRVLYALYPGQRAIFDAALATSLAAIPDGAAKTAGIALGDSIARAIIDIRANDGYLNFVADDGSTAIGKWRATGPMYLTAQDPQWSQVQPFVLTSADEFRAPAPPSLDSAQYAADLNQVESLGSAIGSTRTADQTQQAQFWADGGGSYTPPGHWVQIAAQVAAAQGNSLSANAR